MHIVVSGHISVPVHAPDAHAPHESFAVSVHGVLSGSTEYEQTPDTQVAGKLWHAGGVVHGSPAIGVQLPLAASHVPPVWHPTGWAHAAEFAVNVQAPVVALHTPPV